MKKSMIDIKIIGNIKIIIANNNKGNQNKFNHLNNKKNITITLKILIKSIIDQISNFKCFTN